MFRIFLAFVLLAVSLYAVRFWLNSRDKSNSRRLPKQTSNQKIVSCELCGLHVPAQEAIMIGDNTFCSLEHAKSHK